MGIVKIRADDLNIAISDKQNRLIKPSSTKDNFVICRGTKTLKNKNNNINIFDECLIYVGTDQMVMLIDDDRIVDYSTEEGYYKINPSSSPITIGSNLDSDTLNSFNAVKYNGQQSQFQEIYYINLKEFKDIKFNIKEPLNYFDSFYNAELFIKGLGVYSIKVTNPIKLFLNSISENRSILNIESLNSLCFNELICAIQSSMVQASVNGIKISEITFKSNEIFKYMYKCLYKDWNILKGINLTSFNMQSITYDRESKYLMRMKDQGIISKQSKQIEMTPKQSQYISNSWLCTCNTKNYGKFCIECGLKKPILINKWTCPCGTENYGNFCINCGSKKFIPTNEWTCSCGTRNHGKFCENCGNEKVYE